MSTSIKYHTIENYQAFGGVRYKKLDISYQVFGKELHTAPVVLVNHALTGNSDVASESSGWWKTIVGKNKVINTENYTVIAFNILGNGYDGSLIINYKDFSAKDMARIFISTLHSIGVQNLFAAIGGSLGGGIAWEMVVLEPRFIKYIIPIASDWKSSDWIIGQNYVQESLLNNSKTPLQDARMMAMLSYRTPASLAQKFCRSKNETLFNVESWLQHHGNKLEARFELSAYKMMNHLLTTLDITNGDQSFEEAVKPIQSTIIQIAIDSDLLFVKEENIRTKKALDQLQIKNQYHEIKSIHGHDAFLIEYEQLTNILEPIFK